MIKRWIGVSAKTHVDGGPLATLTYADREFEPLVQRIAGYPAMVMNVMHTLVTDVPRAREVVRQYWDGPVGVYPESGYFEMPNWQFVDVIEPEDLASTAQTWIDDGVRLVGGCCGLGPEHIAALRARVDRTG